METSGNTTVRSEASNSTLNTALMKFNRLNSGITSLDTSVLNKYSSEEEFRFCIMGLAVANNLSLDDDVVHEILDTLLPLVKARSLQKMEAISSQTDSLPRAKLSAEDDFNYSGKSNGVANLLSDLSEMEQSGKVEPRYPTQVLPGNVAYDITEAKEGLNMPQQDSLVEPPHTIAEKLPVESRHEVTDRDNLDYQSLPSSESHFERPVAGSGDVSVLQCAVADISESNCESAQQPFGGKQNRNQNKKGGYMDQQTPGSSATSEENSFPSQQEAINTVLAKEKHFMVQNRVSRRRSALNLKYSTKHSLPISFSEPYSGDVCLPVRPAGWGHIISLRESGVIFSKANSLTKLIDSMGKLQVLRLKLFCLAIRLQQSTNNVFKQVLYRLDLADRLRGGRGLREVDLEYLKILAQDLEAQRQGGVDFECTILVLGRSGVGKSTTINSLFGNVDCKTDAFKPCTKEVNVTCGTVNGLKLRVIDTPGFLPSCEDMQYNHRIFSSVKRCMRESPPDVVLYIDRLDLQCMKSGELSLLRAISEKLGSTIWSNTILVFTHGLSSPPEDTQDSAKSYEMFVAQRIHMLQEGICQAAGNLQIRNLHAIVENHVTSQTYRENHPFLFRIRGWQSQLLFLCFASSIMTEADNFLTFQRQSTSSKVPSLPFSLAVMFQSTVHLKVLKKEVTDDQDSRSEEVTLDSDKRDSFEAMPILGRLTRELGSVLQKHRQNYHGVIKYKRTLFMKKGLTHSCLGKHGITRRLGILTPEGHDKLNRDTLATWMPDMTLPLSFCSDRYWLVQTANGLLPQQVQNQVCRNSDSGHGGLIVEKDSSVFRKLPLLLSGQVNRHAEETNRQLEWSKPPERSLLRTELILQSPHDDAYELQAVTRFSSVVKCLVACGFAVSLIGGCVSAGVNSFVRNRWPKVTVGGGGMIAQNEVSYGGYLEAFFEDNQYPLSPFVSTAGLSIIKLREDVAIDGNIQVQVPLGRTAVVGQACLNNVKTGEIRIRTSSSNQLCMALLGFLPVLCALVFNRSANFRSSH